MVGTAERPSIFIGPFLPFFNHIVTLGCSHFRHHTVLGCSVVLYSFSIRLVTGASRLQKSGMVISLRKPSSL